MTDKNPILLSTVDGHPYKVASPDAWTRCRNKALRRKIGKQIMRSRTRENYDPKELRALAFRETRTGGAL